MLRLGRVCLKGQTKALFQTGNRFPAFSREVVETKKRKSTTMTMLDLRLILVLCCSLQLGCLAYIEFPPVCPPEFPHQFGMLLCLSINEEYLTFDEAQASCIAKGGKLVEPRDNEQEYFLFNRLHPTNQYHGYWIGVTDSDADGVWTYASDNSPLTYNVLYWEIKYNLIAGYKCVMNKWVPSLSHFATAPCEQKARSVCQYDLPVSVCGIRERGELIPFNTIYKAQLVRMPCDYTLASIVCGDYDVRVYGTSVLVGGSKFSPRSARVVVQRALTNETLVSAQVSRDAIAKSTDGKNLWTVTAGAWSTEVSETFETARHAAVIKIGDVGQVDFSATTDAVENGLYVRCKAVRSSAGFPESLCDVMEGTTNWSKIVQYSKTEDALQIFMRVIFLQNAGQQLQCSEIANKVRSCPNEEEAVRTCAPVFIYSHLTKCFVGDKLWFGRCLDAYCNKDVDKCKELKAKMADCGLTFSRIPRVMIPFMALVNSC